MARTAYEAAVRRGQEAIAEATRLGGRLRRLEDAWNWERDGRLEALEMARRLTTENATLRAQMQQLRDGIAVARHELDPDAADGGIPDEPGPCDRPTYVEAWCTWCNHPRADHTVAETERETHV